MRELPRDQEPFGERQSWKPVMSPADADRWAVGSAFPAPVFHVTTRAAARAIRHAGFELVDRRWGRVWGVAVYAATDEVTLGHYRAIAGPDSEVLVLRVNV